MMRTLGLMTVVVGLAAGCAPNTIIRRTALINAPQTPAREGQPLERGDVRLEGHLNTNSASEGAFFMPGIAGVGDPGVLIPSTQLGASVWAGLPAGLEIGAQLTYASMDWANPNVFGVLPFPRGKEEDLFMGGLGLRINVDVRNPRLAFAIMGELNFATIPEAIYVCRDRQRCIGGSESLGDEDIYRFERIDHEFFVLPNLALQLGWRFGDVPGVEAVDEHGQVVVPDAEAITISAMPYLLLGTQASVTNTGFEPDFSTLPDDTLESLWMGYVGFGVDALFERLVVGASLIIPFEGEDAISFGVVLNLKLGVQL